MQSNKSLKIEVKLENLSSLHHTKRWRIRSRTGLRSNILTCHSTTNFGLYFHYVLLNNDRFKCAFSTWLLSEASSDELCDNLLSWKQKDAIKTHISVVIYPLCEDNSISPEVKWWSLLHPLIVERIQLEYLCACLSTLGGAHSSMGDFFKEHSVKAAVISQRQYVVARKMNDPILTARCRIYFAHSLLQRGLLKEAAKIIRNEYKTALKMNYDTSLVLTCCRAAWSKYLYLRSSP